MDLIYTNADKVDQGVLQDYSFDEEYGTSDATNTFKCAIQKYNPAVKGANGAEALSEDSMLYIEFSEYGGIVDRIVSNTKTGEIVYSGRTWHGVLNSHALQPPTGKTYRTYDGEANEVLAEMISDAGLTDLFVADAVTDDNLGDIYINAFNVRYEKLYECIIRMMEEYNGKLIMYYQDNMVHIGAVLAVNYATNEEFDSSQVPFKVGYTYNNVNHLICLGKGDGVDRAVIHLFLDESEEVQPYTNVDNPQQDSDYILDESQKVITGLEERTEILDAPNSEIITNYLAQTTRPNDWKSTYYTTYYEKSEEDGEITYSLFKQVYRDEYRLQYAMPSDWASTRGFEDYYYWDADKDPQYYIWDSENNSWAKCSEDTEGAVLRSGAYAKVKALSSAESTTSYYPLGTQCPEDWYTDYNKYYQPSGSTGYTAVSAVTYDTYGTNGTKANPDGSALASAPNDWTWNYKNYFTRKKNSATGVYEYSAILSVLAYKPHKIKTATKKMDAKEWANTWTNYYVIANAKNKKNNKIIKYKGKFITAQDAINTNQIAYVKNKNYPAYAKNKYYYFEITESAPSFKKPLPKDSSKRENTDTWVKDDVFEKFSHSEPPAWEDNKYYYAVVNDIPAWVPNTYYTLYEDVEQIPTYNADNCYYAVEDRMAELVKSGIEKLESLCDTSTLDIDLELESNYDVLDIVGSIDEVTGIEVNKPILRKIIKIKKDILSVEYEVD